MALNRWPRAAGVALLLAAASACSNSFKLSSYPTNDALYAAAMQQYARGKWSNAITAFDKLTLELPARDTLLPRAYYYLATAHDRKDEHLLAAQSFLRLSETFPDDSLADDALLLAGKSYAAMWRKPELDPEYGSTALVTLRSLPQLYPDSPLIPEANAEIARLEEWFARKDYETGEYYLRRKAYDPAILYFKDVTEKWPGTPSSRSAQLRLVETYRKINYRDEADEVCQALRTAYPDDAEVLATCGPPPAVPVRPDSTPPAVTIP